MIKWLFYMIGGIVFLNGVVLGALFVAWITITMRAILIILYSPTTVNNLIKKVRAENNAPV